jgi:arachidonate 15-lipoxygenase
VFVDVSGEVFDVPDSSADTVHYLGRMVQEIGLLASVADGDRYARERALQQNRLQYRWLHLAGLPPCVDGLPAAERGSRFDSQSFDYDIGVSLASAAISAIGWTLDKRDVTRLRHYEQLYSLRKKPDVASRWQEDEEFARQRLNGTNPLQIQRCTEVPKHFAVTDERVRPVIGDHTLASLAGTGRLYLCDWAELEGVPTNLGRFLTAPMALFWVDDRRALMPLAIQLGQSIATAPVVFTPADERWLWLTARTHVQTADAAYHEILTHLFRTHFAMETVWVALARSIPPQHPVHELLAPHFAGTIDINDKARNELIVPGGAIDEAISVGTDGSYWLINQALRSFTFDDLDPQRDVALRGVDDIDLLPGYHYRDDTLRLWDVIGSYVDELLRVFYPDDATVAGDEELAAWAHELSSDDGGRLRGLPLTEGRFARFADLHHVVRQVIYTASCEHSAVNNGQYDIFGYVPNAPGSVYLPPPTTLAPSCEGEFVYALPPLRSVDVQMTLVHLLSRPPMSRLGWYPSEWFRTEHRVHEALDRFRDGLDQIAIDIEERNRTSVVPYTYLDPVQIAVSINV